MSDSQPLSLAVPPTHHRKPFHLPLESNPKQQRHGLHRKAISESGCNTLTEHPVFMGSPPIGWGGRGHGRRRGLIGTVPWLFKRASKFNGHPKRSQAKGVGGNAQVLTTMMVIRFTWTNTTLIPAFPSGCRTTRHCCELLGCCSIIISRLNLTHPHRLSVVLTTMTAIVD